MRSPHKGQSALKVTGANTGYGCKIPGGSRREGGRLGDHCVPDVLDTASLTSVPWGWPEGTRPPQTGSESPTGGSGGLGVGEHESLSCCATNSSGDLLSHHLFFPFSLEVAWAGLLRGGAGSWMPDWNSLEFPKLGKGRSIPLKGLVGE